MVQKNKFKCMVECTYFDLVKKKSQQMEEEQKLCCIVFDIMHLSKSLFYNQATDQIDGTEDLR